MAEGFRGLWPFLAVDGDVPAGKGVGRAYSSSEVTGQGTVVDTAAVSSASSATAVKVVTAVCSGASSSGAQASGTPPTAANEAFVSYRPWFGVSGMGGYIGWATAGAEVTGASAQVVPFQPAGRRSGRDLHLDRIAAGNLARAAVAPGAARSSRRADWRRPRAGGAAHDRAVPRRLTLGRVHHDAGAAGGLLDPQRLRGAVRDGLGLPVGRPRPRGHELPRRAGRRLRAGDAGGRGVRRVDRRLARDQDLAVLKIQASRDKLVPIRVGTSAGLQVGQKVLTIGNPFGLDHTLTTGILSALGRTIQSANNVTIFDVIQTDAAINPGNSGGPLLDSGGRLVGVNTDIYSPMSFPARLVLRMWLV